MAGGCGAPWSRPTLQGSTCSLAWPGLLPPASLKPFPPEAPLPVPPIPWIGSACPPPPCQGEELLQASSLATFPYWAAFQESLKPPFQKLPPLLSSTSCMCVCVCVCVCVCWEGRHLTPSAWVDSLRFSLLSIGVSSPWLCPHDSSVAKVPSCTPSTSRGSLWRELLSFPRPLLWGCRMDGALSKLVHRCLCLQNHQ